MKYVFVYIISVLIVFGFAILISGGDIRAQDSDTIVSPVTNSSNFGSGNETAQLSSITNFSQIAEDYATSKRLESTPSLKVIDKEAPLSEFEENAEILKENLDRFEVTIPSAERLSFNAQEVLSSNSTIIDNSVQIPEKEMLGKNVTNSTQLNFGQDVRVPTTGFDISNILKSWKGLDIIEAGEQDGISHPPDVTLAVGPDHVVQMVHSAARIWDKNGQEIQTAYLSDFFSRDQFHTLSDPIVIYDPLTEKWISVIMEISPMHPNDDCVYNCFIDVAVSENSDPTSLWKIFRIPFGKVVPDYPMVGISDDKFVFGVNLFGPTGSLGTQAVVMDKSSMIHNNTIVAYSYSPIYKDYYTIYPISSSNTDCMYMEANDYSGLPDISFTEGIALFEICGNPATNDLEINVTSIPILTSYLPPEGDQPSSSKGERIIGDTDLSKIRGPIYVNNTLISAFAVRCNNENDEPQSCIRIIRIELNDSEYNSSVMDLTANDAHLFYPSLSIDNNKKVVIVMGTSSREIYPSGLVATLDQNMNNLDIIPIVQGTANTNPVKTEDYRPRSGDYFAAVQDPIDGSVWVSGEYGDKNIDDTPLKWSTFVANVS